MRISDWSSDVCSSDLILGLEMVLTDGEILRLGGRHMEAEGYDLLGLMTGSEGLLGVITEVTVRILPKPTTARALMIGRSEERRVGKGGVSTCRTRGSPDK